jgi:hypothetical protein
MNAKATVLAGLLVLGTASHVSAQLVVFDPAAFAQAVMIADRTLSEYQLKLQQYATLWQMMQRLKNMADYRTMPFVGSSHDLARYGGAPFLAGLNGGDPRGEFYAQSVSSLQALATAKLPAGVRKVLNAESAALDIADSIGQRTLHQVGMARQTSADVERAIRLFERDVTSPDDSLHTMTVVLDKIAGGEAIARRQDSMNNDLLGRAVEQQLLRAKRQRDADVRVANMRINGIQSGPAARAAIVAGAGNDLRTWRQP